MVCSYILYFFAVIFSYFLSFVDFSSKSLQFGLQNTKSDKAFRKKQTNKQKTICQDTNTVSQCPKLRVIEISFFSSFQHFHHVETKLCFYMLDMHCVYGTWKIYWLNLRTGQSYLNMTKLQVIPKCKAGTHLRIWNEPWTRFIDFI